MNRLHLYSEVPLGQNDRLVPIDIEFEPKTNIRNKLLLILSRVGVPLLVNMLTVYFGAPSMFITLWFGFDY
jgi:hypothetical protein